MFTVAQREVLNPAQRRALEGLLAVDAPRPPADLSLAGRLRAQLADRTAGAAQLVPPGARGLYLSKSALKALDCEGRYCDQLDTPFAWSAPMVVGTLTHHGIDVDLAGARRRDPREVVEHAWQRFASSGTPAARYLTTMGGVDADALRARALRTVVEFREVFPSLPSWAVRTEPELKVGLHEGRVTLVGKPDLLIGRATPDRRRMLAVDLKTGERHPGRDRADMRFYALLATLKYGVAPFRVATYYLDEADWDHEDIDDDGLEAAARAVVEKADRAARLTWTRPPEAALRLVPGPACSWCERRGQCPAVALRAANAA